MQIACQDLALNCKCDSRGRQSNQQKGDWCWLEKSPCTLLTGGAVPSDWTWVRCEHNGAMQIACQGNKIFVNCNHIIDIFTN